MSGPLVVIAGGGTGGHVFPALAVAAALRDEGARVEFIGTARGFEAKLVPREGYPLHLLPVRGLVGKSLRAQAAGATLVPVAVLRALALLGRIRPDVALGVGGYASGPALLAAWIRRIPIALHEQNAVPGLTNRTLARLSRVVAVSFAASGPGFRREVVVTGNPVRAAFFAAPPVAADGLPRRLRLLVFGGSQGAHAINLAVAAALPHLPAGAFDVVHQTGPGDLDLMRATYAATPAIGSRVVAFLDDMPAEIGAADLVVARAGATTAAELAAAGRGAILIPFAAAAGGHQEANARALVAAGAAEVLLEREATGAVLAARLAALAADPSRLVAMGERARTLARPDAARDLARIVLGLAARRASSQPRQP